MKASTMYAGLAMIAAPFAFATGNPTLYQIMWLLSTASMLWWLLFDWKFIKAKAKEEAAAHG